jgi:hypothetical protein
MFPKKPAPARRLAPQKAGVADFSDKISGRTNAWSEITIQSEAISLCNIPTANLPNGCTNLIRVRSISAVVTKIPAAAAMPPSRVSSASLDGMRVARPTIGPRIDLRVQGRPVTASDGPLLEEVDLFRERPGLFPRNESTPDGFHDAFVVGWLTTPGGAADDEPFGHAATSPAVPPTSRSVPRERIDTGPKTVMRSLSAG